MRLLSARGVVAGCVAFASACGDDAAPPAGDPGSLADGGRADSGARDAGADAADADRADANADAAPSSDAAAGDAGGLFSECSGDVLTFPAARAPGRAFSAAIRGSEVQLTYVTASCGGSLANNQNQGLAGVSFTTTGDPGDQRGLVNAGVTSCSKTRDPALVAEGESVQLFYTSNAAKTGYELSFKDLTADTAARPLDSAEGNEFGPAATWFEGAAVVAYPRDASGSGEGQAGPVLLVRPQGEAHELVAAAAGHRATQLSTAALGGEGDPRGVAAWRSDLEGSDGLYLRAFDADLEPQGEVQTLTRALGGSSNVALAGHAEGGAVAYTEALDGSTQQLRFRTLSAAGELGPVVELTSASQSVRDVALTAYSSGYLVVYRRLSGASGAAATLRMMALDDVGNIGGTRFIADATPAEGTQVLVAQDGRIIVVWADSETVTNPTTSATTSELRIHAARLRCL